MIQLHRLECLYRVAKAGGYARAARAYPYPITAPALHQQIRKLESELGVPVLLRTGKDHLVPTSAGRALLEFAEPFYAGLPNVVRALAQGRHPGVLRIEAAAMELKHVLPRWMARLARERPELRIDLREVPVGDPARLLQGDVDLVVDHLPVLPPQVAAQRVATYRAFVVAPRRVLGAKPSMKMLARALAQTPFVAFSPHTPQHALQVGGLQRLELAPETMLSASSSDSILALVREGLGFSLLAWPDARGPVERGVAVLPLHGPGTQFEVVAAFRAASAPDPWIAAALDASSAPPRR